MNEQPLTRRPSTSALDVSSIRSMFPILQEKVYDKPLIYFDNAATTQKPKQVLDCIQKYYSTYNSNVHRGVHYLSQKATDAMEDARKIIQKFIGAELNEEIIFTQGTTGSLNLLAYSFCQMLKPGDEIIISAMEHHANIVPWQIACEHKQLKLRVIPFLEHGELDLETFVKLISSNTKLVSVTHASNTLGTINPVEEIIRIAHQHNIPVSIDGAQAIQHLPVDVQKMDCDFYSFSGHKIYGPTGIGVLYGKKKWLDRMPPYQSGGEMIKEVSFEKTTYGELPFKFEAGTPNIEGIIGLGEAIRFVQETGIQKAATYESELLSYFTSQLKTIPGIRIFGEAPHKVSVVSFLVDGIHPYDTGVLLDKMGIAVRTGHHCTQPIMKYFNIPGTVRASLAVYNTSSEIDIFIHSLERVKKMF